MSLSPFCMLFYYKPLFRVTFRYRKAQVTLAWRLIFRNIALL